MNSKSLEAKGFAENSAAMQVYPVHRLKRGAMLYWAALFTLSATIINAIGVLKQSPQSGRLVALLLFFTIIQFIVAIGVVALPVRRLLLTSALVEVGALLLWMVAHIIGLPDGFTVWRPETLGIPDLYLPILEGVSAFFFLWLAARTWTRARRAWRITLLVLPFLVLLGVLLWAGTHFRITEIILATFFLDAQLPTSLQYFFFPIIALIAILLLLRQFLPRLRANTKGTWQTTFILLPALLITNLLTWGGGISAANTAWFSASTPVHAPASQTTTLQYCNFNGNPLAMDLSEPIVQAVRPAPMVFYIHGGETLQGSRTLEDGSADGMYFTKLRTELLSRGFVVGSIDYGLSPFYNMLNEVKEAKCAVRFLRAYAKELGIDPQRIGVYGPSQGGYISAMLGTVGSRSGYDVGQYLTQSSHVEAVVDMWGPTDLSNFSGSPSWVSALGGGAGSSGAQLRTISPVTFAASGDPPFLIIHGMDDRFIAPHHSQQLATLLQEDAVPVTLVMVKHDGHGLDAPTNGQIEQPSPDALVHMIGDFFSRTLAVV